MSCHSYIRPERTKDSSSGFSPSTDEDLAGQMPVHGEGGVARLEHEGGSLPLELDTVAGMYPHGEKLLQIFLHLAGQIGDRSLLARVHAAKVDDHGFHGLAGLAAALPPGYGMAVGTDPRVPQKGADQLVEPGPQRLLGLVRALRLTARSDQLGRLAVLRPRRGSWPSQGRAGA